MCVCYFFYDDKAMGTHITLSQLDAAAPESSYPLGDKPVSQPALFQILVGHHYVHRWHSAVVVVVAGLLSVWLWMLASKTDQPKPDAASAKPAA